MCERGAYTRQALLELSGRVARALLAHADSEAAAGGTAPGASGTAPGARRDLEEARVALLTEPDVRYVVAQWGIWRAGGVAVPLCTKHPPPELEYVLEDAEVETVLVDEIYRDRLEPLARKRGIRLLSLEEIPGMSSVASPSASSVALDRASSAETDVALLAASSATSPECTLPAVDEKRRAMILYTSGTTSRPKGVVTTHANIRAQAECLLEAWEWTPDDRTLNVLPLHHTHGIVNVVDCALRSGARVEMLSGFEPKRVWERLASGELTVFMAVPTIYSRLIGAWESATPQLQDAWSAGARKLRLMVSGSAALPVSTLERWREISSHVLLERYGMTEIGMALSNSYRGERYPGRVGRPLPGVTARLVDEDGLEIAGDDKPGEIQIKGKGVFLEYWRRPEAMSESFTEGWFRTGDVAQTENGTYRILGRNSVDIIKTGGYKVSALEIEETLRLHEKITECAAVGTPDVEWGERVSVAVTLRPGASLTREELRAWAKERLAPYKIPSRLLVLDELPRNVMGKVTKPQIRALFETPG